MKTKISKKQLAEQWQQVIASVRKSTTVDRNETKAQQIARIKRLENDDEAWFKYYFPDYAYAEPADFHKAATQRVMANPEWYEVRMWSRELSKSTRTMMEVLKMVLVGHLVVDANGNLKRKKKRYVLLISNSEDNAERLLMPYKANLEANERLINDYGDQELPGKWGSTEFFTKTGAAFRGLGLGMSPRGTRNAEVRPDVILFDDTDTDLNCRNPATVKKTWQWIDEAAMGTRSISADCMIIFCGNRIAKDCVVVRAAEYADYHEIINIRDDEGKSTWPQKNTEERIDRILAKRSYAAQQKEYYNNPIVEGSVFEEMTYKPARPLKEYSILVAYTDPSYKDSKKNDYKATVLVGKWKDEFHVIKAFVEQTTTAKMIGWHYELMAFVADRSCYYYMEDVFLQDLILGEFYKQSKRTGRTIPISGDKRQKDEKFTRIESLLEPLNSNGKLYLNEDEKSNPHMKRLYEQFMAFAAGSRAHDDGPDAVEGAVWIINQKQITQAAGNITIIKRPTNSKRW